MEDREGFWDSVMPYTLPFKENIPFSFSRQLRYLCEVICISPSKTFFPSGSVGLLLRTLTELWGHYVSILHMRTYSVVSDSLQPYGPPDSSVHGISQARILEWVLPFPSPGDFPNKGIKPTSPVSPAWAGGFFTTEPPGKPQSNIQILLNYLSNPWQVYWLLEVK